MKIDSYPSFHLNGRLIGEDAPTYFIADIAANHDGDLRRAIELVHLAKDAGADAAKFQHFRSETIVSHRGFLDLGDGVSHQKKWKKPVSEVYKDAEVPLEWTATLKGVCDSIGIDFFTSPYDLDIVDQVDQYVPAYKIGSGDITWTELIQKVASKNKPYFIATGASSIEDVSRAVRAGCEINNNLCLMQCNTNYTGSLENLQYVNLNVLKAFSHLYPNLVLGLSDHTPGHATALGAITLGAKVIEKHFTDDVTRSGPDHAFSMTPKTWTEMVQRARELEAALGDGVKKVEANETETVWVQRRAIRASRRIPEGALIQEEDVTFLRPCPSDGIPPYQWREIRGSVTKRDIEPGAHITYDDI